MIATLANVTNCLVRSAKAAANLSYGLGSTTPAILPYFSSPCSIAAFKKACLLSKSDKSVAALPNFAA